LLNHDKLELDILRSQIETLVEANKEAEREITALLKEKRAKGIINGVFTVNFFT
jgi:hypothetical protein